MPPQFCEHSAFSLWAMLVSCNLPPSHPTCTVLVFQLNPDVSSSSMNTDISVKKFLPENTCTCHCVTCLWVFVFWKSSGKLGQWISTAGKHKETSVNLETIRFPLWMGTFPQMLTSPVNISAPALDVLGVLNFIGRGDAAKCGKNS